MPMPPASGALEEPRTQIIYPSAHPDLWSFDLGTGVRCHSWHGQHFAHFWCFSATFLCRVMGEHAPCRLRGCKNGPAPFPGRMSYKATKPGLVCLSYLSMLYYCTVVYYGPFLCIVSFRCCVFCLLVVLAKLPVLAKWLARKTTLRKPNRGEGIISIKPRLKSAHDFLGLLYCFIVLLCIYVVSCPTWYIILLLWRDGLFVLKVPLNPKQTNKQYGRTRVKRDVMTLTFDLLGHCACVWCGSSYTPSLYQHWIS